MAGSIAYTFTYNGLSFGAGTAIPVTSMQGFEEDLPAVRSADLQRSQEWGSYAGLDTTDVRDVTLTMFLRGSTPAAYDALCQEVAAAFVTQGVELPMVYSGLAGVEKQINCRPRKRSIPRSADGVSLMGTATVMCEAMDPRIYSAAVHTVTAGLGTGAASGISWNVGWPLSWGATTSTNMVSVQNAGSVASPFTATITGPCVNPVITNGTTGQTMAVTITLGSSDVLVLDFGLHTITLDGTASRRGLMVPGSSWWTLPPNSTTNHYFAAGAATSATCQFTWQDAWA